MWIDARSRDDIPKLLGGLRAVIEHFHAKSERGVRQELYAAFTLVTLARQFVNRCDSDLNSGDSEDLPAMRTNFKNGLRLVGREIEAIFLKRRDRARWSTSPSGGSWPACPGAYSARGRTEATDGNQSSQGPNGSGDPPPDI